MDESPKPVLMELEYSGPREPEPLPLARTEPLYRFTLGCWLLPLALGVADFLLYVIVRSDYLAWAGLFIILFGTLCSFIGFICAISLLARRWGRSGRRFDEAVRPTILLLFLLGSNYAVAIILAIIADVR